MTGKKIVLTGGHAATMAISVVEEIIRRGENGKFQQIFWLGSPKAIEGTDIPTTESIVLPKLGVNYIPITAGRIQMKFTRWTVHSLFKIPIGFFDSCRILRRIRPDIILSFGGFSAFPVAVIGKMMNIPVVIHEQTTAVGRANKYATFCATKIALARDSSRKYFPNSKCVLVGNPILTQVTEVAQKMKPEAPPVIYITGGSRGSQVLNKAIEEILISLLGDYFVIHNTGRIDYSRFVKIKDQLPEGLRDKYEIYSFIDPMKIDNIFRQADVLISRAGAASVSEIIVTKRPAVLIPIPWSYGDEQTKNAEYAEKLGLVKIIKQDELTGERLLKETKLLIDNYVTIASKLKNYISQDISASFKLVNLLEENLK